MATVDPTILADLLAAEDEYDPDLLQSKRLQTQANRLRQAGFNQQGTHAGRVYVAPGALNAITGIGAQLMANQREKAVDPLLSKVGQRRQDALKRYTDSMAMQLRRNYPTPIEPVLPPDGMEDQ